MADITEIAFLIGRVLFGGYFAYAGINHFVNRGTMVPYAEAKGVPAPKLAVLGTGSLLVVGGLSVLTGLYPLVGLGLLAVFLVGVTPQMHDYWTIEDPVQRMGEQTNFLKNAALLGAVLALSLIATPWPLAL